MSSAKAGPVATAAIVWAVLLGGLPLQSLAAGSPSSAQRIKSVHELIVEGDRPEISACLYAAEVAVSKSHDFDAIRWDSSISDASVVREYRLGEDWVRVTKFEASARTGLFFSERWVDVLVECQQVDERVPTVTLRLKLEKTARDAKSD